MINNVAFLLLFIINVQPGSDFHLSHSLSLCLAISLTAVSAPFSCLNTLRNATADWKCPGQLMCNISRQATRLEVLRLLCIHVDAWMHRKLIKPPFRLQTTHRPTLWNPFWHSIHFIYVIILLTSLPLFPLCCRPFWSLFCRLAHVTRIFAQLKSIKLHFRLNKLGCHTSTHPIFPSDLPIPFVRCLLHSLCTCLVCCPRIYRVNPPQRHLLPSSRCQTLNTLFSHPFVTFLDSSVSPCSLFSILCFWTFALPISLKLFSLSVFFMVLIALFMRWSFWYLKRLYFCESFFCISAYYMRCVRV